jgi:hypothetical protein
LGETGPEYSSAEELRAKFSPVRNVKNKRNLQMMAQRGAIKKTKVTDHNQSKERIEPFK